MNSKTKEMYYEKVRKAREYYNMLMNDFDRTTFEINSAYQTLLDAVEELNKIEYDTAGLFYTKYYVQCDRKGLATITAGLKCNEKE